MTNLVLILLVLEMLGLARCIGRAVAPKSTWKAIGKEQCQLKWLTRSMHSAPLAGIQVVDRLNCTEIQVCLNDKIITILEAAEEAQEALINIALETKSDNDAQSDPYGSVLWPAARAVSLKLSQIECLSDKTVLELGSGTGLVSLFAANIAKRVVASDFNQFCLKMIKRAIILNNIDESKIEVIHFDIKDSTAVLPQADVVVLADVLYDKQLGIAVAHRVYEALVRGSRVIVGDSPTRLGREPFLDELRRLIRDKPPRSDVDESCVQFEWVLSESLTTFRNPILSKSNTTVPESIRIGILCI